ncbi:hypothetical protein COLO4_07839 [Corchorus olitorius]|uniref:Uncharacterized protein n=1 Tax=Corchorus olitorius TaxID=93759 RepID=A0A1R3KID9_9ROSI|nr:hypothetical protein COLO4_07839 [Corchorus olitorius]
MEESGFQIAVRYRNSGRYLAVAEPSETAFHQISVEIRNHTRSGVLRPRIAAIAVNNGDSGTLLPLVTVFGFQN